MLPPGNLRNDTAEFLMEGILVGGDAGEHPAAVLHNGCRGIVA